MIIRGVKQISDGVMEITPDSGSAFFLRIQYLSKVAPDKLVAVRNGLGENDSLFAEELSLAPNEPGVFTEEEWADILFASLSYSVECVAMTYLARAEHSRFLLSQKLAHKQLPSEPCKVALDFLEDSGALSDLRFATAWLRSRAISHAEGKKRLEVELYKRGVSRENAKIALDDFFSFCDEDESCVRAYKKLYRKGIREEKKMRSSLLTLGFSSKRIERIFKEIQNGES